MRGVSHTSAWRHVCALAAAANILVLMTGNLVGFVVGMDGVVPLLGKVLGEPWFVAGVVGALFSAAQLMFALRAREAERKALKG